LLLALGGKTPQPNKALVSNNPKPNGWCSIAAAQKQSELGLQVKAELGFGVTKPKWPSEPKVEVGFRAACIAIRLSCWYFVGSLLSNWAK
jgi:hypothetical protein